MFIKINSDAPVFKCNACGSCCSHIRGMISDEDKDFVNEYAFGKLPVVQLVPAAQMTFPLWDWEAKRFNEWKKDVDVEAEIKPLRVIFDQNSGKSIVLNYFIDSETDACPFLKENKCSIYHTKRAYVCRLFPFNRSFVSEKDGQKMFGECGAMERIIPEIPSDYEKMVKFLNAAFPDGSLENAVQNDLIIEWSNKVIVELIKTKIIRPAVNHPYEFLLKRIALSEKIDFTDFLFGCGYKKEEEIRDLIWKFDNNEFAKEKINSIINPK